MAKFGQPLQPLIFPEAIKFIGRSYLPRFAQNKRVKRPVVGMCRRCGQEFFTSKSLKNHPTGIGCNNV